MTVIGFDDMFAAELTTPTLTTLGGPDAHAGRLAVEMLLDLLRTSAGRPDQDAPRVRLPTSLVLRASSGPAAPGA